MLARPNIKGVVLEEVLLYLLRAAGYRTVSAVGDDPTLGTSAAGLQVKGRGGEHQIDAIADFVVGQPFSNSQRLLVEAKCYGVGRPIGLAFVRNAVGVIKDVSEYWTSPGGGLSHKTRYRYQYALFATTDFTRQAQRYAFAHDIHLLPLRRSAFFAPIIVEIESTARRIEEAVQKGQARTVSGRLWNFPIRLPELRHAVRVALQPQLYPHAQEHVPYGTALNRLAEKCRGMNGAVVAMVANRFPVFLVPAPGVRIAEIAEVERVRIMWNRYGWYIVSAVDQRELFSFDLPAELFELYAEAGILGPRRALDMKQDFLAELQAVSVSDGRVRLLHFELDTGWLEAVRARVKETPQPAEAQTRG